MKKWHRIVLVITAALVCCGAMITPLFFGLLWLPRWPEFLAKTLPLIILFPIAQFLLWPLRKKKETPKKELLNAVIYIAVFVALNIFSCFWIGREKKIEYLHSPNHVNTALLEMWNDEEQYAHGRYRPIRAQFFYKSQEGVFWTAKRDERTCTWLDDNTLEIAYIDKRTGQEVKEYIRW